MFNKKPSQRIQMLNTVTDLLMDKKIKPKEREILLFAKKQLEDHEYMPRIINDLKAPLTRLAVRNELSSDMAKFYSEYIIKNLGSVQDQTGMGIAMNFGSFFH